MVGALQPGVKLVRVPAGADGLERVPSGLVAPQDEEDLQVARDELGHLGFDQRFDPRLSVGLGSGSGFGCSFSPELCLLAAEGLQLAEPFQISGVNEASSMVI